MSHDKRVIRIAGKKASYCKFEFLQCSVMNYDLVANLISKIFSKLCCQIDLIILNIDGGDEIHINCFIYVKTEYSKGICRYIAVFAVDLLVEHLAVANDCHGICFRESVRKCGNIASCGNDDKVCS